MLGVAVLTILCRVNEGGVFQETELERADASPQPRRSCRWRGGAELRYAQVESALERFDAKIIDLGNKGAINNCGFDAGWST